MAKQHHFSKLSSCKTSSKSQDFGAKMAKLLVACSAQTKKWMQVLLLKRRADSEPIISSIQQPAQPGIGGGGEECIWQKGILMGGKCQLPEYSGIISYDTHGKLVAPAQRPCLLLANAPFNQ